MLLLWTSIPILMLSGASFPREAIPEWLYALGQVFPSSHGVNAFIRIRSMGRRSPRCCPKSGRSGSCDDRLRRDGLLRHPPHPARREPCERGVRG